HRSHHKKSCRKSHRSHRSKRSHHHRRSHSSQRGGKKKHHSQNRGNVDRKWDQGNMWEYRRYR
ncbi:spore coat protein CotG, partial [Bacillus pumilus]|nr:spore coat protein CotG [Bacillus pumilus]